MKMQSILLVGVGFLLAGCGDASKVAPVTPPDYGNEEGEPKTYADLIANTRKKVQVINDYHELRHGVESFKKEIGRNPSNLVELVQKRYIDEIPKARSGYRYDFSYELGVILTVPEGEQERRAGGQINPENTLLNP